MIYDECVIEGIMEMIVMKISSMTKEEKALLKEAGEIQKRNYLMWTYNRISHSVTM